MAEKGVFHAFGLFWRADEVDWSPGKGAKQKFRLLGHCGENLPNLRVVDFRHQQGIYILYGNYGPYYVGLTRTQGLGKRLKDHRFDHHSKNWERFSWFSFGRVLSTRDADGLQCIAKLAQMQSAQPNTIIGDIEAILQRAMALQNLTRNKFAQAEEWEQVKLNAVDLYMEKVGIR